jgi:hypothetical protein
MCLFAPGQHPTADLHSADRDGRELLPIEHFVDWAALEFSPIACPKRLVKGAFRGFWIGQF